MNFDNLSLYKSTFWNVLLTAWFALFLALWIFARNQMMLVVMSVLITAGVVMYIRQSNINFEDLSTLPVYSIFVIWGVVLIILLSYVEKLEETRNPEDRPATDSIWSMIKYRASLLNKNSMIWTYILVWFCLTLIIIIVVIQMPTLILDKYFGEPANGHLPGWAFMVSLWWILFMLINLSPSPEWNQRNMFIGILMALGMFGVWSAKMIPGGMAKVAPSSLRPVMYFTVLFILLFTMVYYSLVFMS